MLEYKKKVNCPMYFTSQPIISLWFVVSLEWSLMDVNLSGTEDVGQAMKGRFKTKPICS
jgi:hypothetical protein